MSVETLSGESAPPVSSVAAPMDRALALITEPIAAIVVVAEILVLLTGVIARFAFNHPLTWSDELASIMFLWLAMLGAAIAQRRGQHMRMTALVGMFSGRLRGLLEAAGAAAPALFYADWVHPLSDYESVSAYLKRLRARPSFERCVEDARPSRQLFPGGVPAHVD